MVRHTRSGPVPLQYVPLPYRPSSLDASCVSSASCFGSFGGGIDTCVFSSMIARAVSADIFWPSNFFDCSIHPRSWVRLRSLAFAATSSLSSLMSVEESHCAEVSSGKLARYSALTRAMNWSAVSPSGGGVVAMPPGAGAAGSGAFLHPANVSTAAETASASKRERGFTGWVLHGRRKARVGGQARGLGVGHATFRPGPSGRSQRLSGRRRRGIRRRRFDRCRIGQRRQRHHLRGDVLDR